MWMEITVVILNLLYVILIARGLRLGWIPGIVGSALFVASNIEQHLYMDACLNGYYVLAGIYGWWVWGAVSIENDNPITLIPRKLLIAALALGALLIIGLGTFFYVNTDNTLPYLDATVTILSFIATWMAAKKYIENWIIWLVADPLAIILYTMKGGWLYPALFVVYTIMAIYGYLNWKKQLKHAA